MENELYNSKYQIILIWSLISTLAHGQSAKTQYIYSSIVSDYRNYNVLS